MDHFRKILADFPGRKVAVVGDIMLDRYIMGSATRISPEAPVPVVKVQPKSRDVLGGAANVAANIASLKGKASLFGFIGTDEAGRIITELAEHQGIEFFPSRAEMTTEKVRIISADQQLLRMDYEEASDKNFDDFNLHEDTLRNADIVVVSDYSKGTVTPELMQRLKSCGKRIIADTKPMNCNLFEGIYLLKINEKEASGITSIQDTYKSGENIRERLKCNVLVTRGSRGAILFDGSVKEFPATAREVYDVTGAGDTVLAALAISLAAGSSLDDAAILANHAAGIKVEKFGTLTVTLSELEKRIFKEENKIKTREELKEIISDYHKKGKTVVWTNGCFDILHQGHIRYLKKAAECGDVLVVGLNSDESVRQLKGQGHPRQNQDARAEILSAIEVIDYVTIFPETRVTSLMQYLQPDVFVKGGDYVESPEEHVPGKQLMDQNERAAIKAYGGKIRFIPIEVDISTSKIIQAIREGK